MSTINRFTISYGYVVNKIFLSPQLVLFSLFLFILHKKLGATPFQLTVATAIKPLSSIPAYGLGGWLARYPDRVNFYLITLLLLAVVPSLLFPLIDQVWYAMAVYALYMIASKAMVPPWIELAKRHLERKEQCRLFAIGNAVYYGANLLLPLLFSQFLDRYSDLWPLIFIATALFQALSIPFLLRFPSIESKEVPSIRSLFTPLKEYPAFRQYLLLFFVGGSSFVLLQPVLPLYFQDVLNLSYTEVALAFSVCKGLSFLATMPLWTDLSHRISLYLLNALLLLMSICYIGSLSAGWVMLAYLFYGALQGGSEQSWTLSGPYFSKERESIRLTSINYLMGGIRGAVLPFFGIFLYQQCGVEALFTFALLPALWGIYYGLLLAKKECIS